MITHEQAAFIRVAILLDDWDSIPSGVLSSEFYSGPDGCDLEPKARAAIAEYEAAHVMLTKDQLGEVFKSGYRCGLDDGIGGPYEESQRWRLSNIWDNLQAEKP